MDTYINIIRFLFALKPLLDHGQDMSVEELQLKSRQFREMIVSYGPTFIKFGQILSIRYDILNRITCNELQILLDEEDQAMDFTTVEELLRSELGEAFTELSYINPEPIATASLGQVHLGKLKKNSKLVAIKVQKKGIKAQIKSDVAAIYRVLNIINLFPVFRKFNLQTLVHGFTEATLKELNYSLEAANLEKFNTIFKSNPHLVPANVIRGLSTEKILTTEYIEGISAKRFLKEILNSNDSIVTINKVKLDPKKIKEIMEKNVFQQIFTYGFVHGDPHPSNIIIIDSDHIALIDFGMVLQLSEQQRYFFKQFLKALALEDSHEIVKSLLALDQESGAESEELIVQKLQPYLDRFETSVSQEYSPTELCLELFYICGQVNVQLPQYFGVIGKVMATYDGMLQIMEPQSNLVKELVPLFEMDQTEKMFDLNAFKLHAEKSYQAVNDMFELVTSMPGETLDLIRDVRENGLKIHPIASGESSGSASARSRPYELIVLGLLIIVGTASLFLSLSMLGPAATYSWILLVVLCIIILFSIFYLLKK